MDARNRAFCKTKRVSDDVWGSLSADGSRTVSAVPGSCSDRPRSGTASSGIALLTFLHVVFRNSVSADRSGTDSSLVFFANVLARSSIVFCNLVSADRSGADSS